MFLSYAESVDALIPHQSGPGYIFYILHQNGNIWMVFDRASKTLTYSGEEMTALRLYRYDSSKNELKYLTTVVETYSDDEIKTFVTAEINNPVVCHGE